MTDSDEALCRRAAAGDADAFEALVERYQARAWRIAWSILRDREDARDCSQDAFVRLHESAGSFAGQARFSTWFYRILVNCCLDHQRRRRGWRRLLAPTASDGAAGAAPVPIALEPAADPGEAVDEERRRQLVWAAVDGLAPQQRLVVLLQCQEGLPTREVAAVLDLSEATVRVHLHRAFSTLRRRVSADDERRASG